jgi:carbohydrate-selective porin OprB
VFPHQTCDHVEVAFLNASDEILLRKVAEYDTSAWQAENPRKSPHRSRYVSFSLHIPMSTKHLYLQPDVQYILYPGGFGAHSNALVSGLRFDVTF